MLCEFKNFSLEQQRRSSQTMPSIALHHFNTGHFYGIMSQTGRSYAKNAIHPKVTDIYSSCMDDAGMKAGLLFSFIASPCETYLQHDRDYTDSYLL